MSKIIKSKVVTHLPQLASIKCDKCIFLVPIYIYTTYIFTAIFSFVIVEFMLFAFNLFMCFSFRYLQWFGY